MTNIAIIGLGKLGSAMAALYASSGHKVVGVDIDDALIERLQAGTFRTDEPEVNDLLQQSTDRLTFTRLPAEAVHASEIVFVVVPTPSKADGTFDSSLVVTACQQIGAALYEKKTYTLVVVVSTLMPGQMDADVVPVLERTSGKRAGAGFGVCYSPEFIALGRVIAGLRKPDYVLIGECDERAGMKLRAFAMTIATVECKRMSFVNAELAKLATNAYLSLKIAYANVLGQICENIPGANVDVVTQAVGSDHRIGMAYLRAGLPAGGPCLPRDLAALTRVGGSCIINSETLDFWSSVNDGTLSDIIWSVASKIDPEYSGYAGFGRTKSRAVVGLLGTAYSPTTSIEDGSFANALRDALMSDGFNIQAHLPSKSIQEFVDTLDVVILALPLDNYKTLIFHDGQAVYDLWRTLDPSALPATVTLWQLGVGVKVDPYKGAIHGDIVSLSGMPDKDEHV